MVRSWVTSLVASYSCGPCLTSAARWGYSGPVRRPAGLTGGVPIPDVDAVVDCWGGGVVTAEKDLTPKRPVAPIDYTADLACPILGLFGNDDSSPSPEQVDIHEQALIDHGKTYEFHRYPDAGHGFFYYHRPNYRQQQAVDGWEKIFAFLAKYL